MPKFKPGNIHNPIQSSHPRYKPGRDIWWETRPLLCRLGYHRPRIQASVNIRRCGRCPYWEIIK